MNTTAAILAGTDMLNMGGLLDSLMDFDYAKVVIDNEIALMLKRINRGLEFSEENLSLGLIAEIGPGGTYSDLTHTINHMRTTAILPEVADHEIRNLWEESGRPDTQVRALNKAKKILTQDNPSVFSKAVDDRIHERFKGLVSGNAGF